MNAAAHGSGETPSGAWVFLDLDGTFSTRSTEPLVTRELRRTGWFTTGQLARVAWCYARYKLDLMSDLPATKREVVAALLTGLPEEVVTAAVDTVFHRDLLPRVRPQLVAEMADHRRAGRRVALLTSTLDVIGAPFQAHFGFDTLVAARLEVTDGTYTGRILGDIAYGEAKARLAGEMAQAAGVALTDCFAYGDRFDDRFLLTEVGTAVAVDPDRKLAALARTQGWRLEPGS